MSLILKSFPQSTRPSLQTPPHLPERSGKCPKALVKAALTRPSLQTSPRVGRFAAAVLLRDCPRSIAGACVGTRASSRDGVAPTRAGRGPGSRGSRHHSDAWSAASVADAYADRPQRRSTFDAGPVNAAEIPRRTPHTGTSPWNAHSAQGNLSEAHPAPLRLTISEGAGS